MLGKSIYQVVVDAGGIKVVQIAGNSQQEICDGKSFKNPFVKLCLADTHQANCACKVKQYCTVKNVIVDSRPVGHVFVQKSHPSVVYCEGEVDQQRNGGEHSCDSDQKIFAFQRHNDDEWQANQPHAPKDSVYNTEFKHIVKPPF